MVAAGSSVGAAEGGCTRGRPASVRWEDRSDSARRWDRFEAGIVSMLLLDGIAGRRLDVERLAIDSASPLFILENLEKGVGLEPFGRVIGGPRRFSRY